MNLLECHTGGFLLQGSSRYKRSKHACVNFSSSHRTREGLPFQQRTRQNVSLRPSESYPIWPRINGSESYNTHTHTHTHTHNTQHKHTHSHTHSFSLTHTHTHTHSLTHTHTHTHTHIHTHTHSFSLTHTHTHTLSHSHTHTHRHTHTYTHRGLARTVYICTVYTPYIW